MHTPIIFFCYFSFSKKRFQNLHRCFVLHDLVPDFFLICRSSCVSSTFCFCCHNLQTPFHKIDRYNHNLLSYSAFLNWHTTISSDTHLNRTSFFDAWVSSPKQHHNKDTLLFFACNKRRLYLQTPQECQQFFYNRFLALAKCQFAPFDLRHFIFLPYLNFVVAQKRLTIINTVEKRVEKIEPPLENSNEREKKIPAPEFFSECRDFFLPNRTKRDIIVVAAKAVASPPLLFWFKVGWFQSTLFLCLFNDLVNQFKGFFFVVTLQKCFDGKQKRQKFKPCHVLFHASSFLVLPRYSWLGSPLIHCIQYTIS